MKSEACNFIKKETRAQVFSSEFCEISKNTFFTEHLWATASGFMSFHNASNTKWLNVLLWKLSIVKPVINSSY